MIGIFHFGTDFVTKLELIMLMFLLPSVLFEQNNKFFSQTSKWFVIMKTLSLNTGDLALSNSVVEFCQGYDFILCKHKMVN